MPQYWLKPLGVTQPHDPMPNDWTTGADLDSYAFATGPATHRQPPQIGPHDRVIFHAVIHVRVFAEGEILDVPRWERDPVYDLRWPWVYRCRVDLYVPEIAGGLPTSEIAPKRALGLIQAGGDFAPLRREEYESMRDALAAQPAAIRR